MLSWIFVPALIFVVPAVADCGGEDWVTPPTEIAEIVRFRTRAVLIARVSSGAAGGFQSYSLSRNGFIPGRTVPFEKFIPISRVPDCPRPEGRHELDGGRFAVVQASGAYVLLTIDARRADERWFKTSDLNPYWIDLDSPTLRGYLNPAFAPHRTSHPIYAFPEEGDSAARLDLDRLFRADGKQGDFIRMDSHRWRGDALGWESLPIGWVRLRTPEGELLFWPWYQDDC